MSAYFIATYDITDPEAYQAYVQQVIPLLMKHKGEVLVADYEAEALEGEARSAYIVLRFASEEALRGWYEDPDYEAPKQQRFAATTHHHAVAAHAFVMPTG